MDIAQVVSSWSKDPSTKVGAVIVNQQRRIVATGYNGFPAGVEDWDSRYKDRNIKCSLVVHAEANAILNAVSDLKDCVLLGTQPPCGECAKLIIQSGITRVVSPIPTAEFLARWDMTATELMFAEANVCWEKI